ncbi:MAG: GTPase HflX [Candidatus Omnitrophica bacterium]|nr:GTPase HflX [Candidatus Omnitrophota bacterium]HOX54335.1 GTPase HflX [Candidatus Omnitrophota bacterium]
MEKAILVSVDFKDKHFKKLNPEDSLAELEELTHTAGAGVTEKVICMRQEPTPGMFIGKGKAEEIAMIAEGNSADTVIFDDDISGTQQRNLEEIIKIKIIDRTQLILDIFAQHAKSQEGKIQVELAQLEYLLPRLTGKGIILSRLGGGIGTRGPGEQKLEVDRRRIRKRIDKLRKDLSDLTKHRENTRKKRKEKHIPSVALVGYTNAGKSTLLNTLTGSEQHVRDSLFTTLDSLSRSLALSNHQKIVISDTVGFLSHLPHHLIEAFKATLEEVKESDLLLHVLDVSHARCYEHNKAVYEVLKELGADDKPIVTVLNKIDKLEDRGWIERLKRDFINPVAVSALKKENIEQLLEKIETELSALITVIDLFIPINRMDLVDQIYREGEVYSIDYNADGANIKASLPIVTAKKLSTYHKQV